MLTTYMYIINMHVHNKHVHNQLVHTIHVHTIHVHYQLPCLQYMLTYMFTIHYKICLHCTWKMLITHKNVYEIQSFTTKFSKIFWAKKKIAPRLAPRRKSCSALITACSREILSKNMLRVYTIIRDSRVSKIQQQKI